MKIRNLLLTLSSLFLLASCGTTEGDNTKPSGDTSENSGSSGDSLSTKSFTVSLSDEAWKSTFSGGTKMLDRIDSFKSYINSKNTYGDSVVSEITANDYVFSTNYDENSEKTGLTIGTSGSGGRLAIDFSVNVVSITLKLTSYWRSYENGGTQYYYETDSKVQYGVIGDFRQCDLKTEATGPAKSEEVECEKDLISHFVISNSEKKNRVIVEWMTIEYR